jgi:gamma-glutamylcyclotransferase (GGCT)/AIG2-like uncharacterized protein YtfP
VSELVFFYGTLMTGFDRRQRLGMDDLIAYRGRGRIEAKLFDLGLYPAAVPAVDSTVHGELFELLNPTPVLEALDDFEGYDALSPDTSLYVRRRVAVQLDEGGQAEAWAYFYNAPLGAAPRITSGDYLEYLKLK